MKYDQIKELLEEQFRRLTGVKKATFQKMLEILREADEFRKMQHKDTKVRRHKERRRDFTSNHRCVNRGSSNAGKINGYKIRTFGEFWSSLRKRRCFTNHKWHSVDFFVP